MELNSDEIISKYEEITTEQMKLLTEILKKWTSNELNEEQKVKIKSIGINGAAHILDICTKEYDDIDVREIKNLFSNVIDECTDKNR